MRILFSRMEEYFSKKYQIITKVCNNVRDSKFSALFREKRPFASRCFAQAERRAFDREFELVMGAIHSASPLMRGNLM